MELNPYLFFAGDCEAAFKFYESCLDGKIGMMMRHEGSPMEGHVPPEWRSKIMHASMTIDGKVLMASDGMPGFQKAPQGFSLSLGIADPAEAERKFSALAEGGTITMPIAETFWALRFGTLVDKFGIPWMINCEKPMG